MKRTGTVWKYGDNIDTDVIIPARYLNVSMPEELARHCMEDLDASFVGAVQPGDDPRRRRHEAAHLQWPPPTVGTQCSRPAVSREGGRVRPRANRIEPERGVDAVPRRRQRAFFVTTENAARANSDLHVFAARREDVARPDGEQRVRDARLFPGAPGRAPP